MTNQEAVDILISHYGKRDWCRKEDAEEALRMAIEALERLIREEPKARANGKMVLDSIRYHYPCIDCLDYMYYGDIHCSNCERYKEYNANEKVMKND